MPETPLNATLRDHLEQLATECRSLLEEAKPRMRHLPNFEDFPNGSCGDASLVMAWYLREHGITEFIEYVSSQKTPSHAWLEVEGWLLDITADQRAWGNLPVWIMPAAQSPFHEKHYPVDRRDADLDKQCSQTKSAVRQAIRCLHPTEPKTKTRAKTSLTKL